MVVRNTGALDDGVEIRDAGGKGDGVFATRRFRPSDTVLVGRVVGRLEGNTAHATQVGRHEYVLMGGAMPKVNHSCDPNCGCRFGPSGTYSFVARRALEPGEEITFDYAMRNWSIEHFPSHCQCGSRLCRGRVTGWKDLPPERKAAYDGLVAPYLLEMDREAGHPG
jgi:uncharacterized protein